MRCLLPLPGSNCRLHLLSSSCFSYPHPHPYALALSHADSLPNPRSAGHRCPVGCRPAPRAPGGGGGAVGHGGGGLVAADGAAAARWADALLPAAGRAAAAAAGLAGGCRRRRSRGIAAMRRRCYGRETAVLRRSGGIVVLRQCSGAVAGVLACLQPVWHIVRDAIPPLRHPPAAIPQHRRCGNVAV
jgi:hypothetical protein